MRAMHFERCLSPRLLFLLAGLVALPLFAHAQTKQSPTTKPIHGDGRALQQAVIVPFVAVRRDEKGRVINPIPPSRAPEEPFQEHGISAKAIAEKALANARTAPPITKPTPNLLGLENLPSLSRTQPPAKGQLPHIEAELKSSAPVVGVNFQSLSLNGSDPPDVAMAAGPNQIVAATNVFVGIFDKLGNTLSIVGFGGVYAALGSVTTWNIFDPVVRYDDYIKRFWVVTSAVNGATSKSDVLIALSNGPDASDGWSVFAVDMTQDGSSQSNNWCDYPRLGFDSQAIYITCNMSEFPNSSWNFQYGKVRIMGKTQFLKGGCCSWHDVWNMPSTVQPATMRHAKNSDGEFLTDAQGDGSGDTLDVWHFPDPLGNPSQLDQTTVSVSGYYTPPNAHQPNPNLIDTGDSRLQFAVWQDGNLSTGQNTLCSGYACAAFYELDVSKFPSVSVVNDWALQQPGIDYYYPAVDENANSDKIMVYTISASDEFASAAYVGVPNSKTCPRCISKPEGLLAAGTSSYVNYVTVLGSSRNRWGDYFSAAADPDGLGVWISGEFAETPILWGTQVGVLYNDYLPAIKVSPTSVNFSDTQSSKSWERNITVTNTGNADLTINSVQLVGSSDFSVIFDSCQGDPLLPSEIFGGLGPGVLEAKQSCVIIVMFNPRGGGEKKATLNICSSITSPCLVPTTVTFTFDGPVINKISPNNGPLVGATVTLTGGGLSDKFKFDFGGADATDVSCATSTTCTMVAPAHAAGPVDVIAKSSSVNSSANPKDLFTYEIPTINKVSPSTGPAVGGESVVLTGVGFYSLMTAKFGDTPALGVSCPSSTLCSVISPPGVGLVNITVTLSGVTSIADSGDFYTYANFPAISSLSPNSGPVTGGTVVTVTGTNFSTGPGFTTFHFGSLAATDVTCSSFTQCTVTAPVRDASAGFLMADVTATVVGHTSIGYVGFAFGTPPPPPPPPPCKGPDCH